MRLANKVNLRNLLLCILMLGFFLRIEAQRGIEIGGHIGTSMYFGDLNNGFSFKLPGATAGADIRYNFDERLCLKTSLNYVFIRGNDKFSANLFEKARNLHFINHLGEFNAQLEMNFLTYKHGSKDQWYTPYLFLGGGVMMHGPRAKYDGHWYSLRNLGTEGQRKGNEYSIVAGSWLFGLGFKMDVSTSWSLNIDLSCRQAFTDYLDDVSTNYVEIDQIEADRGPIAAALSDPSILIPGYNDSKIGVAGRQRGDKDRKDAFSTLTVGLLYYFGQVRCPDILNH